MWLMLLEEIDDLKVLEATLVAREGYCDGSTLLDSLRLKSSALYLQYIILANNV